MHEKKNVTRRGFIGSSLAAAGTVAAAGLASDARAETPEREENPTYEGMPCGYIGGHKVTRLMFGGNLLSGYMHCRDLRYVNQLFRSYATRDKVNETLALAEKHGINIVFGSGGEHVIQYNQTQGGKLLYIATLYKMEDEQQLRDEVKRCVDRGAIAIYFQGHPVDKLVRDDRADQIKRCVEIAKDCCKVPVGVGGHCVTVPPACEAADVPTDFYVQTLHGDNYFSATRKEERTDYMIYDGNPHWQDNMWCSDADKMVDIFSNITKPWIAFKVLAAGAIRPREGMTFAYEGGGDFVPVGMFDFQVEENCELAARIIRRAAERARPWRDIERT